MKNIFNKSTDKSHKNTTYKFHLKSHLEVSL